MALLLPGSSNRRWLDGLELNIYEMATDPEEPGELVERRELQVVRAVKEAVSIPVAIKLSPFYSSIANFSESWTGWVSTPSCSLIAFTSPTSTSNNSKSCGSSSRTRLELL